MTPDAIVDSVFLLPAALMITEKIWKYGMVVRFFRNNAPEPEEVAPAFDVPGKETTDLPLVSILQPILSGDPTLSSCLEHNLRVRSRYPREMLWLVDEDDVEGQRICRELIAHCPDRNIVLILTPRPEDRCSPKTFKLILGAERARGEILCVLDDDTMLPDDGLELCLPYLERPGIGLAFGLPYYVNFSNFWSSLVSCFVNSNSLLTYIPYTYLSEPFTINGMFFAVKRSALESVGGFQGLETELMDDFAIAQRFRAHGFRLAQTPLRHGISTYVEDSRRYFRLLHRWFIFPRETVLKALPWKQTAVVYGLGLGAALFPLLFLVLLAAHFSWPLLGMFAAYLAAGFLIFCHLQHSFLPRPTPVSAFWMAPVLQFLLPFQILAALFAPQKVVWRGHLMQIEPGGRFRFERRRQDTPEPEAKEQK